MKSIRNELTSIEQVVKNDLCLGCGTCAGLCPSRAITLIKNKRKGIYLPKIDKLRCKMCGLCIGVCPGYEVSFKSLNLEIFGREPQNDRTGYYLSCYSGASVDPDIRFNSASGGLVTTLLIHAIETGIIDGALVTRMNRSQPLEPEPFIARTRAEIIEASRSKYCPVPANTALRPILETEGRYACVGLPCHIHSLRKAEKQNNILKQRVKLHIGIFCATSVNFNGTEFLLKRIGIDKNKVSKISYRGNGWPGYMTIELKDKKDKIYIPLREYSNSRFLAFAPWRCKMCIDHTAELSDISLGDAWCQEYTSIDPSGTSFVIVRNDIAEKLVGQAVNDHAITLSHINVEKVVRSQGGVSDKKVSVFARINLTKFLRKKSPEYDIKTKSISMTQYTDAIVSYTRYMLSLKKPLWWLLIIYCSVNTLLKSFMSKYIGHVRRI